MSARNKISLEPSPRGLWSLWDMLQTYFPIYQLAIDLGALRSKAAFWRDSSSTKNLYGADADAFRGLLTEIHERCSKNHLTDADELAQHLIDGPAPENYAVMFSELNHLNYTLGRELGKEAVFRIPPDRKNYFERNDLFGPGVATAFPSCARDIEKVGSCYALGQEDACVHHLMLVLERGLAALATKVDVTFHYTDWKKLIDLIEAKLKSGAVPRGPELDFYRDVNAQFGFLKEAYRKHSAHARDDFYDLPKALHIFNHVKDFMQALAKGGLSDE